MPVDPSRFAEILRDSHLFRNLNDVQLEQLAQEFIPTPLAEDDLLFREGDHADSFYIVCDGKVQITVNKEEKTRVVATLVEGDYFGEEAYFTHHRRTATVKAVTDCTLMRMNYSQFAELIRQIPHLKANLQVSIASRRLARNKQWDWFHPDEVVYVLMRKHPYFLFTTLILPGIGLAIGVALFILLNFILTFSRGTSQGLVFGGLCVLLPLLWVGWNALDWSNDYYFVTNLRVIWLEVIAGLYKSRQEAPLNTILSVSIDRGQIGRAFDFGTVIVRTYTVPIPLKNVGHPEQISAIIEEHWRRSKIISQKEDATAMEQAIRAKLGMSPPEAAIPEVNLETSAGNTQPSKPGFFQTLLSNIFQVRIDTGDVVTYRKHWFVLLEAIWLQAILLLFVLGACLGRLINLYTFLSIDDVIAITVISAPVLFLWLLYDYIDWHNDIYQVTPDQILDINRKPLGTEDKKAAPLENILSIEYERLGFLGVLFNFGTVYIKVGTATFDFDHVFDPSQVQQDIFRRKLEREAKHQKAEKEAERDRLASWIATYHRTYGEILPNASSPSDDETKANLLNHEESEEQEGNDSQGEDKNGLGWID